MRKLQCNTLLHTGSEWTQTNNAILQPYGLESSRRTACRNKVQIIFPPNGNSIGNFYPNKGSLLRSIRSTGGTQERIAIYFFSFFTLIKNVTIIKTVYILLFLFISIFFTIYFRFYWLRSIPIHCYTNSRGQARSACGLAHP